MERTAREDSGRKREDAGRWLNVAGERGKGGEAPLPIWETGQTSFLYTPSGFKQKTVS